MFNIKFIKADNTTYLIQYKKGKVKRKGNGLAFWYFAPNTSLVAIPTSASDVPFMFKETTQDYQDITIQGQLVYRVENPDTLASVMNFTLTNNQTSYVSEDPETLKNRIMRAVQVSMRNRIEKLTLKTALSASDQLVTSVFKELRESVVFSSLGVELVDLSVLAIKPSPDTARALEASVREQLLQEADDAIYTRRNASIDQERKVKENELNTELAVQNKKKQLQQEKMSAERALQEAKRQMQADALTSEIEQEADRQNLVKLSTENQRKLADANAYEVSQTMKAWSQLDPAILESLAMSKLQPEQLLAQAFKELAGSSSKIGQLNIAPDLFQALTGRSN